MTASRHLLHPTGNADAVLEFETELTNICGPVSKPGFSYGGVSYFNLVAEIEGTGLEDELLVIGAHLDSTARNDDDYDPETSDAPGADDNLSGVAAVLEVARAVRGWADQTPPERSIRFVLFNAEEQGMVGSQAYADLLKQLEGSPGEPSVIAMIAMDMVGWRDPTRPRVFEIHGTGEEYTQGTTGREYQQAKAAKAATDQLAAAIQAAAQKVAPALIPQIYPLAGFTSDPMTRRSDHWWFQHHHWPACLVSEDMWLSTLPMDQAGNPHYHLTTDLAQYLDFDYLTDIVMTVATAAWKIANPNKP